MQASNRMRGLAGLCQGARRVIDVGCDHAQLCGLLVSEYGVEHAYAADIRPGPLENAKRTISALGLGDKITPVLGDGLAPFGPQDADTIIIAGMGGQEIAGILERAPWTKTPGLRLVLQPMTAGDKLRKWLGEQGYGIGKEIVIADGGKLYAAMHTTFGIDFSRMEEYEYLFSRSLMQDPLWPQYLAKLLCKYRTSAAGQRRAGQVDTPQQRALAMLERLEQTR